MRRARANAPSEPPKALVFKPRDLAGDFRAHVSDGACCNDVGMRRCNSSNRALAAEGQTAHADGERGLTSVAVCIALGVHARAIETEHSLQPCAGCRRTDSPRKP